MGKNVSQLLYGLLLNIGSAGGDELEGLGSGISFVLALLHETNIKQNV